MTTQVRGKEVSFGFVLGQFRARRRGLSSHHWPYLNT
jgi:hypothetical protein